MARPRIPQWFSRVGVGGCPEPGRGFASAPGPARLTWVRNPAGSLCALVGHRDLSGCHPGMKWVGRKNYHGAWPDSESCLPPSPKRVPDGDQQLHQAQSFHSRTGKEEKDNALAPQFSAQDCTPEGPPEQVQERGSPFAGRVTQGQSGSFSYPPAPDSELR